MAVDPLILVFAYIFRGYQYHWAIAQICFSHSPPACPPFSRMFPLRPSPQLSHTVMRSTPRLSCGSRETPKLPMKPGRNVFQLEVCQNVLLLGNLSFVTCIPCDFIFLLSLPILLCLPGIDGNGKSPSKSELRHLYLIEKYVWRWKQFLSKRGKRTPPLDLKLGHNNWLRQVSDFPPSWPLALPSPTTHANSAYILSLLWNNLLSLCYSYFLSSRRHTGLVETGIMFVLLIKHIVLSMSPSHLKGAEFQNLCSAFLHFHIYSCLFPCLILFVKIYVVYWKQTSFIKGW